MIMFDKTIIITRQFYLFLIQRLPVLFDPGVLCPIARKERKVTKSIMFIKPCERINNRVISTGLKDWEMINSNQHKNSFIALIQLP